MSVNVGIQISVGRKSTLHYLSASPDRQYGGYCTGERLRPNTQKAAREERVERETSQNVMSQDAVYLGSSLGFESRLKNKTRRQTGFIQYILYTCVNVYLCTYNAY